MIGIDALINTGLKIIDKVIPDPLARDAAKLEWQRLYQEGQLKYEEFDVQREEIAKNDRDSARNRQIQTKDDVPTILAGITIIGFFATVGFVLSGTMNLTGEQGILIGTIVGYVSAKADQVLSYYFGSSNSSKTKSATIDALTKDR